jgi:sarcosine oxidase
MPLLGLAPSDARLVVACGFWGSGLKFAPIMGEIAADFAMDGSTGQDTSFLAPQRHLLEPSASS